MTNRFTLLKNGIYKKRLFIRTTTNTVTFFMFQTMQATKRNAGVPSAMVARQSLNDEELVSHLYYRDQTWFSMH